MIAPKGIELTFRGPTYPDSSDDSQEQSFNLRLLCASESSGLTFSDYDGSAVWAEWSAPQGCGSDAPGSDSDEDKPNDDEGGDDSSESHMGSGLGYFFLLSVSPRSLRTRASLKVLQAASRICCVLRLGRVLQLLDIRRLGNGPDTVRNHLWSFHASR